MNENVGCHGTALRVKTKTVMALLTVHSIPLFREFQSTIISRASLFAFSCSLLCLLVPLFVAYNTQGFWVKHQIHREQPDVSFKYQALLLIRSPEHDEITWSTFARYNELSSRNLVYPSITVYLSYSSS